MFWDNISSLYDLFENVYNRRVYNGTGKKVAELIESSDAVLECACGTGAISRYIAPKCRNLTATDFSEGMLRQAKKKCQNYDNVVFGKADITHIEYPDQSFDKAIAGNVIHLLPHPEIAMKELERVVRSGGMIIIPTYINKSKDSSRMAVRFLEMLGASFKRQFDPDSYKAFFDGLGYKDADYYIVDGKMPCMIAVITRK